MTPELEATLKRLEEQICWYDAKADSNQCWHRNSTIAQSILSIAVPITAWLLPNIYPAILGALVALLTSLKNQFQWEYNWVNYRSTCEKLKHEKHLFNAKSGPYAGEPNSQRILAERVEGTVSREHASWITLNEPEMRATSN